MATLASSSSSSSPRCVPFAFRRGGGERRARGLHPAPAAGSHAHGPGPAAGCGRPLCRAAEMVGGGIRGAFFASLDWCACMEVRTKHDDSFRMADAAAPLMMRVDGSSCGAAPGDDDASGRKVNSKQRRGRLGCCAANSASIN